MEWVDAERRASAADLNPIVQRNLAQYFTPVDVARHMASMLPSTTGTYRLLDPGAGIGVLSAAAIMQLVGSQPRPSRIEVTAWEADVELIPALRRVLEAAKSWAEPHGVPVAADIREGDFLRHAASAAPVAPQLIQDNLWPDFMAFDGAILNPPYGKIGRESRERRYARILGVEVPNIYAAFWVAAARLVRPGGSVVSITPRSFANGTYFRPLRQYLQSTATFRHLHLYEDRDRAFMHHDVLQENVITHLEVGSGNGRVVVSSQARPGATIRSRTVAQADVLRPGDPDYFVHVAADALSDSVAMRVAELPSSLAGLGLEVSTGPVVDFRVAELLRRQPTKDSVPLIYPAHLACGRVRWPNTSSRKPNWIQERPAAERRLLRTDGNYVLAKRFTAKEEPRRVVAALFESGSLGFGRIGIENHLNYFHAAGKPMDRSLAIGLTLYLNSDLVDAYVRRYSGHTQVNATDLRSLRYPPKETLQAMGRAADPSRLADPAQFMELEQATAVEAVRDTGRGIDHLPQYGA